MEKVSATEIKNRLGTYLDHAIVAPVVVEKSGRPFVVMLSYKEYERLTALEDAYWGERAKAAEKSGYLSEEESMRLLNEGLGAKA
jgi:antitoxin Phd